MYLRSKIKFKTGETKVWISLEGTKTTTFNALLLYLLEKEMAAHSSVLAWRTPWTEKPSRPQFMGSQRVGHNWVTNTIVLIGWSHWFTIYLGFRLSFHLFIRLSPPQFDCKFLEDRSFLFTVLSSVHCSALCLEYCRESECLEILGNSSTNL